MRVLAFAAAGALVLLLSTQPVPHALAAGPPALKGIRVSGNHLVNFDGQPVRLIGVNRSGTEYACIRGWGTFEGPTDALHIQLIHDWHANAVRIGLNEDCWLGINGVPANYGGPTYQQSIIDYVNLLTSNGVYAIVDLHWSAPGTAPATSLRPMPDQDHSVDFWRSVATTFADNPNVVFDLFNEPYLVTWDCWRDGCVFPGGPDTGPWQTVGMQSLVTTVRATGATQPIMLGGLAFANDLSQWQSSMPDDPLNQLVVSAHVYPFNPCNQAACWDDQIAPLATRVPVIVGEVGTDWTPPNSDAMAMVLMRWADEHHLSYLAWTLNTWGGGDALLTSYSGEPTAWGADFKTHLARLAVPRLRPLIEANAAYAKHDVRTALELYGQVLETPASGEESSTMSAAIDGLARFRRLVGFTLIGDEDQAAHELASFVEQQPGAPLARLAAQFWDQYGMTTSARAACAQLAPQVDSQAVLPIQTLNALGVQIRHDELCVI